MSEEKSATRSPKRVMSDDLFEQIEKARVIREETAKSRAGRRLIVPFRDALPTKRVDR